LKLDQYEMNDSIADMMSKILVIASLIWALIVSFKRIIWYINAKCCENSLKVA